MNKIILVGTFILGVTFALAQSSEIYCTDNGAINGYDPVAFFNQNKPVEGKKEIKQVWNNAEWHFASEENKKAFDENPLKYAPQYGGYCAYGTADGHKAPTQVNTWTLVNGKLYFNYNLDVKKEWMKDQTHYIEKADKNWPAVKKQ